MIFLGGEKETVPGCVLVLWSKEVQVDEETLTSSYQWTERRGFDPSPEPLPKRLAKLPGDGE